MKKIILGLLALVVTLGLFLTVSPAQATPIPPFYNNTGWWDTGNPRYSNGDATEWLYDDFPIACNTTTKNAFRALWTYPSDTTSNFTTARRDHLRMELAGATSGIEASTSFERLGGPSGVALTASHSPRWVTVDDGNGNCFPAFTQVAVPRSVLAVDPSTYPGGLNNWLDTHGYLATGRKLVVFNQYLGDFDYAGVSYSPAGDSTPGPTNANNYGGDAIYLSPDMNGGTANSWGTSGAIVMHEMTHSLGAVSQASPHYNPLNGGHPTDCYDILCYGFTGIGEVELAACGFDGSDPGGFDYLTKRQNFRLDCNWDDYWNPVFHPTWETQRWNSATSSFLWLNPQPPAGLMGGSPRVWVK